MGLNSRLVCARIQGYRPFRDFQARFGPLKVLVGVNGSGKSSLFEFFRFLRDSLHQDIPPEIIPGSIGQQIFHSPGPERFRWSIEIATGKPVSTLYDAGNLSLLLHYLMTEHPVFFEELQQHLRSRGGRGEVH